MPKLFKNLTLREKYCLFFDDCGYKQVESRNRFTCYKHPEKVDYYLVGNNGYVRRNYRPVATGSISVKIGEVVFNHFCSEQEGKDKK